MNSEILVLSELASINLFLKKYSIFIESVDEKGSFSAVKNEGDFYLKIKPNTPKNQKLFSALKNMKEESLINVFDVVIFEDLNNSLLLVIEEKVKTDIKELKNSLHELYIMADENNIFLCDLCYEGYNLNESEIEQLDFLENCSPLAKKIFQAGCFTFRDFLKNNEWRGDLYLGTLGQNKIGNICFGLRVPS